MVGEEDRAEGSSETKWNGHPPGQSCRRRHAITSQIHRSAPDPSPARRLFAPVCLLPSYLHHGHPTASPKNLWVAAGDGDLDRVRQLIEDEGTSFLLLGTPTPTPQCKPSSPRVGRRSSVPTRHAAASYGHIPILEYLISRGGDVNITDEDGDTPLYTVENLETAQFLVQHGAVVVRQNNEGVSPIDHLAEDFPPIAEYLRSTLDPSALAAQAPPAQAQATASPSEHSQNAATEELTTALMQSVQDIMQRAEAEGRDPEEELRQAVSRTVLQGVATGFDMSIDNDEPRGGRSDAQDDTPAKRPRSE
ncbi:hypothetical protein BJ912DRAFT_1054896 [Pholiota molesta]|nr:hypothetical protein BJ912DRAFT_1054896 [Pholiota molesta]